MDEVLKNTPPKPRETNSQYGTRIHKKLERAIEESDDFPGMKPEVSFTVDKPDARYGTDGSIRVDVIEDFGNGTACIYDYKLGKAVLRPGRMLDIAQKTFESQRAISKDDPGKIRRIIMTEVRRKQQRERNLPGQLLGDPRPSD